MVQWLRLRTPNAGGPDSIPGQGTRHNEDRRSQQRSQLRPSAAKLFIYIYMCVCVCVCVYVFKVSGHWKLYKKVISYIKRI